MKLYLHSWYLNMFMAPDFWYSVENQVPALIDGIFGDAVKEVQLYEDYGFHNGEYPFFDEDSYYYPLSVLIKKKYAAKHGDCATVWLQWRKDALKGSYDKGNPFAIVGQIPFAITQTVPAAFWEVMANKPLSHYERSARKVRCTFYSLQHGEWGDVAQSFLDVFGTQISERLHELVPQNTLTNRWNLRIHVGQTTVEYDGWHYRPVKLLNPQAEALVFAVKWQEPVDVGDEISDKDIHVFLAEDCPFFKTEPFDLLKRFLADGTYVFSQAGSSRENDCTTIEDAWRKTLNCAVEYHASWPDVRCELYFSQPPVLSEIARVFAKFNEGYNRRHHRAPIHYIGEPTAEGTTVFVDIDFGSAEPKAMEQLAVNIKKAKWSLVKVCFT